MSKFVLERLGADHDRKSFSCGMESIDRYLKETARGHQEKNISVTRVLVDRGATPPERIAGFFTLSQMSVEARAWGEPRGLPQSPVPAVLLARMGVATDHQREGISKILVAAASQLALDAIDACGGIGLVVDAAGEDLVAFYEKFGFRRVDRLRLFVPAASLRVKKRIGQG